MAGRNGVSAAGLVLGLVLPLLSIADTHPVLVEVRELYMEAPEQALDLLNGAIEKLDSTSPADELYDLLHWRVSVNRNLGRLEAAFADTAEMERLARKLDDPARIGHAFTMRGSVQRLRGEPAQALTTLHQALDLLEDESKPWELAQALLATANVHVQALNEHERARPYYERAIQLAEEVGEVRFQAGATANLAVAVQELEGAEAALPYYQRARSLAEQSNAPDVVAYISLAICSQEVDLNRIEEAEISCREAIERLTTLGHVQPMSDAHLHLGNVFLQQEEPEKAFEYFQKALELATDADYLHGEAEAYGSLSAIHEQSGDDQAALAAVRRQLQLREQILDEERRRAIEELEQRHEARHQLRRLQQLELEAELGEIRLQRRTWMLVATTGAFVLTALLAAAVGRGYQVKGRLQQALSTRNSELESALQVINRLADEDPLTGLNNRRSFLRTAGILLARARRSGEPSTLVLADIDHFKDINDQYGHAVGDEILKEVAERIRSAMREMDLVCRWGGEEILLLLADTSQTVAKVAVERIRSRITGAPIETAAGPICITFTFGIAAIETDLNEAIVAADRAMYSGKAAGRNRIVIADPNAHGERDEP